MRARSALETEHFEERAPERAQFADRLNTVMRERGITAAEATRRIRANLPEGTSFAAANLSHYRSGRSVPRLPYLKALSLALGVDATDLLGASPTVADLPSRKPVPAETILSQDNLPETETPCLEDGGRVVSKAGQPGRDQTQAADQEPKAAERMQTPPKNFLHVEDYGSEVRIQVDQRLPWDKALQILQVLKTHGEK